MNRRLFAALFVLMLGGCSFKSLAPVDDGFPRYHERESWPAAALQPVELAPAERMSFPSSPAEPSRESENLYSFMINNMTVRDGLRQFARAYDLNVVVDEDVQGVLDVEFRDMPLDSALSLMLDSLDYYWTTSAGVIRVRSWETRRFSVDYLRLVRTGTGKSTATVSSSASDASGGSGGEGEDAGSIVIGHEDEIEFWAELEEQVGRLLSDNGRVVVNRLSGTVQVSDQHGYVESVSDYIEHVNRSIHRQVDIEVRILEVLLDDSNALGVNWSRMSEVLVSGTNWEFSTSGIVSAPAGGISRAAPVLSFAGANLKNDGSVRLAAVVEALEQQGEVEIVSQPHVRTMNNQTSLIKVGTDRTFFRREQSTDSTSAGSITTATDVPQVVTEGVVLSITPQIGEAGWIMMDISPVVTRVSSVSVVEGPGGVIQSSAPNLDVAQVSSLIRAKSGDTVVLGGLIQTQESDTSRTLPGLSRLGGVRNLFGGTYKSKVRKELIMVLTPTIVAGDS